MNRLLYRNSVDTAGSAGLLGVRLAAGAAFRFHGWQGGSYELGTIYFAIALLLLLAGPGRFSLDWLLFGRPRKGTGGPGEPAFPPR